MSYYPSQIYRGYACQYLDYWEQQHQTIRTIRTNLSHLDAGKNDETQVQELKEYLKLPAQLELNKKVVALSLTIGSLMCVVRSQTELTFDTWGRQLTDAFHNLPNHLLKAWAYDETDRQLGESTPDQTQRWLAERRYWCREAWWYLINSFELHDPTDKRVSELFAGWEEFSFDRRSSELSK
jgi:hypothetical protein